MIDMFPTRALLAGMVDGRGQRKATVRATEQQQSESRIINAKPIQRSDTPIQRSETITSMTAAEPDFAQLYREAHAQLAECRAVLGGLTVTIDRMGRAASVRPPAR